jgi:hypothetical protein
MKRREFIGLAFGTVVLPATTSRVAWAVEPYRIALLHPSRPVSELTENSRLNYWREFFHELRQLGYIEGNNLVVERFSGEGRVDHHPELAREAAARNPNVIFAITHWMVRPLKEATKFELVINLKAAKEIGLTVRAAARPRRRGHRMMLVNVCYWPISEVAARLVGPLSEVERTRFTHAEFFSF